MAKISSIRAALLLDGLAGDARAGFEVAAGAGYSGIAISTNHRELSPEQLGASARRHLQKILAGKGLAVESLRVAVPRGGLTDSATIDQTLDAARKGFGLARELGVRTLTMNIGAVTTGNVAEGSVVAALRELAQRADALGMRLALGADGTEKLAGLLKQVDYDHARIELSGARSIAAGEDAVKLAQDFAGRLGQFSVSDAVRAGNSLRVVELGQGQLALAEVMEILREQGFDGPTVVDVREMGDGAGAARRAAGVIGKMLARQG